MTPDETLKTLRDEVDHILASHAPNLQDISRLYEIKEEAQNLWEKFAALRRHCGQTKWAWYELGAEELNSEDMNRLHEIEKRTFDLSFAFGDLYEHCEGVIGICDGRLHRRWAHITGV